MAEARILTVEDGLQKKRNEAAKLLVTAFNAIGDAIIATDGQGVVTFMNEVAQKLTGWKHGETTRLDSAMLFRDAGDQSAASAECPVMLVIRSGMAMPLTNRRLRTKNGAMLSVDGSVAPISYGKGSTQGTVLLFRESVAGQQTRRPAGPCQGTAGAPGVPFFSFDPDGRILDANEPLCRLTGYGHEELLSMTTLDLHANFRSARWRSLWEQLRLEQSMTFPTSYRTKWGEIIQVSVQVSRLKLKGREYGFVVVRGVTGKKDSRHSARLALPKHAGGLRVLTREYAENDKRS